MATRNQQKTSAASIVPGVRLDLNPFFQRAGTARLLDNWIPEKNRLIRKAFSDKFQTKAETATGEVWCLVDFRYHRSGAPESQFLVFRSDGKIYKRTGGAELEIFPAATGFSALNSRPKPVNLSNRLFFADSSSAYVYDGRTFRAWGIAAPSSAPVVTVDASGSGITAASGLNASFTWVALDEAGNRVHESTRSTSSAFTGALADDELRIDITGITPPDGVTHWSGYMSELNVSNVRRRVNTSLITTLTFDVSSFPAGTAVREPKRNDQPSATTVMAQWKNRIAMRDETDKRRVWFTAFGEVKALNNGSPEESVPGKSSSSLSDIVNEFRFPDPEVSLIVEHANYLVVFTMQSGYAIVGTGGILDNLGTRGLSSHKVLAEGATGPHAGCTTPFGLAWLTPGRKINLWSGQIFNIGDAIQSQLNTIPSNALADAQCFWWDGHGRKWLVFVLECADSDDLTGTTAGRILVYDFDLQSDAQHPGEWFEWSDRNYTWVSDYFDGAERFLLGGDAEGEVYKLDVISNPCHLDLSMILGKCYLGSTIQDNPAPTLRTGIIVPNNDQNATGLYVSVVRGDQAGPSRDVGSDPNIRCEIDPINPDIQPTIALSVDDIKGSGEYNSWLAPHAGGNKEGALGKQFQFEVAYEEGFSDNAEGDGRLTVAVDALYKVAFSWQVEMGENE